jgi:hypothetical protein
MSLHEVPHAEIHKYYQRLGNEGQGITAHFVFSADEMGHQEWADLREKLCYIPATHEESHVYTSRLHCSGGSYLKPLSVISDKDLASMLRLR